jgi:diguanylate cyclase (GGDEF)-like protein
MFFGSLNVQQTLPLKADSLCREAIDFFVANPSVRMLATVDAAGIPVGSVSRTKIIVKAAGQFGRALYDKRPITEFIDPPRFVVTARQDLAEIAGYLSDEEVTVAPDGYILVDEEGLYQGVVDGLDVLRAILDQNMSLISSLSEEVRFRGNAEREARRLADTDTLTGLSNRRLFIEAADDAVSESGSAVLVYLDLDRFKFLNDKYGHAVGDDALKITGERIRAWRPDAFVARLGGDEFGILIKGTTLNDEFEAELAQLHESICTPFISKPGAVSIGASMGAASFPADSATRIEWFHAADKAMQRAKSEQSGVRTFDSNIDLAQAKHWRITESLKVAVADNQIRPAFQPFVNAATGQVVGYEVLARWFGPEIGFTPGPAEFVPIAERLGLIDDMFWNVAGQALDAFVGTDPRLKIALNVSPIQFSNRLFPVRLAAVASRAGMRFDQIEIEITETAMFRDMAHTVGVLRHLSSIGMSIALDDFGTGYSSLTLVKELPLTKLKIDKSFIQSSSHSASSEKIVAAAIGLSKALGFQCCAEGVETAQTLHRLRELECDLAQGYLFGAPSTALKDVLGGHVKAAG